MIASAILAACGDDAPEDAADAAVDGRPVDAASDANGADVVADATEDASPDATLGTIDRTPDPSCGGTWVVGVTGEVRDEAGAPVEDAFTQTCVRIWPDDVLACLNPPQTDATGIYEVLVPESPRCMSAAAMRVVAPEANFATTYCHMELTTTDSVLTPEPFVLYRVDPPVNLPDEGDRAAMRTVQLADGVEIDVIPEQLGIGADYSRMSARRVALDATLCFLEGTTDLTALYAFGLEGRVIGTPFPIRFPNTEGLAPGTEVDLLILGGLDTQRPDGTYIEEADIEPFGRATVSDDGRWVASDLDAGLPYFSWVGYRPR
ncbi:MAG: hypothetical protein AAGF12_35580 [Myxococcota bacterium]